MRSADGASATLEVNSALLGEVGGRRFVECLGVQKLRSCLWFGSCLNAGLNQIDQTVLSTTKCKIAYFSSTKRNVLELFLVGFSDPFSFTL